MWLGLVVVATAVVAGSPAGATGETQAAVDENPCDGLSTSIVIYTDNHRL